ncbi:MAG: hypothetical protein VXU48_00240 [Verrucomicrobiota bacterium]|nr:hypothetical protein [Verrucomicrobiota bacterium]
MSAVEQQGDGLSYKTLSEAFGNQDLFENKTWRYSPKAFPLSPDQIDEIGQIGQACYEF